MEIVECRLRDAYIAATVVGSTVEVVLREAYIEAAVICSECCQLEESAVTFTICEHDKRRIACGAEYDMDLRATEIRA